MVGEPGGRPARDAASAQVGAGSPERPAVSAFVAQSGAGVRRGTTARQHATAVSDQRPPRLTTVADDESDFDVRHAASTESISAVGMSHRLTWQRRLLLNLLVTDTLVVAGSVFLGQYVRFGSTLSSIPYANIVVSGLSLLVVACWLIALASVRARSPRVLGSGIEEYRRVVAASFATFGAIAIAALLLKVDIPRGYLAIGLPVGVFGLIVSRWMWRRYLVHARRRGRYQTTVLLVGERSAALHFAEEMTEDAANGYQVSGVTIPGYGQPRGEAIMMNGREVPILGDENYVLHAISACEADTVAIAGTEHFGVKGIQRLIWDLESKGVDLMVSTGVMDVALSRLVLRPTAGVPVMHIEKPLYQGAKKFQKRFFDVAFSATALMLISPILMIVALAIKLTSRGPVFYSAERIGIDGRPFQMLKFRTMVQDADKMLDRLLDSNEGEGLLFKIRDDPRITPVGSLLRRLSIDELPQFINSLRGQMSVVGPRPPLRREVEGYDRDVSRRLLVKPGITGLWQVSGRSDLAWDKAVRLDLAYVDNWSMIGDLFIIMKTLVAVLRHEGAY